MLGLAASLAFLGALGLLGVAILRRVAPFLDPVERLGYGLPLGATAGSLALLIAASLAGHLSPILACATAVAALAVGTWLIRSRVQADSASEHRGGIGLVSLLVLGVLFARWLFFWSGAVTIEPDGLYVGSRYLYGDFAQHLGDVMAFAWGDNFPPVHPRFAFAPFSYHYLTSITSAALVVLGLEPQAALTLPGFLFSCAAALAVFAFARRLAGDSTVAGLVVLLFFVGGGLGWWLTLRQAGLAGPLWDHGTQQAGNFRWLNVFFALVAPQRGYLYGLPIGLLVLRLLQRAVAERGTVQYLVAGLVAGLLPFAHLGTLLALALATPILFLAQPDRRWAVFFGSWVLIAAPQLWVQQGPGPGALAAFRWAPGWVAAPDPWILFWLKNVGLLFPLAIAALVVPGLVPDRSRRWLTALLVPFFAANLVVFQPWDWDNSKVLVYAYLAGCVLGAAALVHAWRAHVAWRVPVVLGLCTLVGSGGLENVHQGLGRDRHRLLDAEEVELARRVREETEPRALFVCGLQHNHPVPVLGGRRVLLSYPGWHWSQGLEIGEREQHVRAIFALGPDADALLERYGVSYVVVGPWEHEHLGADPEAFRARFPSPIRTARYEVFDVRAISASSGTTSATRTPAP